MKFQPVRDKEHYSTEKMMGYKECPTSRAVARKVLKKQTDMDTKTKARQERV